MVIWSTRASICLVGMKGGGAAEVQPDVLVQDSSADFLLLVAT